nr:MAG TPA: hypothetical protein [Caudoviricetes sp.]
MYLTFNFYPLYDIITIYYIEDFFIMEEKL